MTIEERLKRLSEASGLSEQDLRSLIEKKKEDAAGLLTDHGALYALEKEYGINSIEGPLQGSITDLAKLAPNLNNVNIIGVVKDIRPVKLFRTDKRSGKLSRVLLADRSGEAVVVFWDKNAEIVESDKLRPGAVLLIRNAYTKPALNGGVEVHVGGLSRIMIDPKNLDAVTAENLPKITESTVQLGQLRDGAIVSTYGRIRFLNPKTEFDRPDGTKGQRSSMVIEDATGRARVVMWGASADKVSQFKEGDVVKVENAQVKPSEKGPELHIGNYGRIILSDVKIDLPAGFDKAAGNTPQKIADLSPGLNSVSVIGRVLRVFPVKEFVSNERTGKLASLIIADDTGVSRVVMWAEKANIAKTINKGDVILICNAYTKQSLSGEPEVHISSRGSVVLNPENVQVPKIEVLIDKYAEAKRIGDLGPDDRNVKITGVIKDVDEGAVVYEICPECGANVENVAGEWLCELCGEVKPSYSMVISCEIGDGTGDIRSIFFRDAAEELTGMSVAEVMNIIGQSGDELEPARQIRELLRGAKASIVGNIRYNDFSDKLELTVNSLSSIERRSPEDVERFSDEPPATPSAKKPTESAESSDNTERGKYREGRKEKKTGKAKKYHEVDDDFAYAEPDEFEIEELDA